MIKKLYLLLALMAVNTISLAQNKIETIYSDVNLFWSAFDKLKTAASREDSTQILETEYLQKGSSGVAQFTPYRIYNAKYLQKVISKHPRYYTYLRQHTDKLSQMVPLIQKHYLKLQELYPDTNIPRVYFVIGALNSAGTIQQDPIVGVDMFGMYPETPTEELSSWLKTVVKPIEQIDKVVIHELVHILQKPNPEKETLLSKSIGEGAADFIGSLASGGHINVYAYTYGDAHEQELWQEFQAEMDQENIDKWLYNGHNVKDRPADLGYYIGYKICEAYYVNAADKKQAVKDILEVQDYKAFLKKSGYTQKFSKQATTR